MEDLVFVWLRASESLMSDLAERGWDGKSYCLMSYLAFAPSEAHCNM